VALIKDNVKPSPPLAEETLDDRPIWEIILESGPAIPPEERAAAPHDGARNYKHYLYGRNAGKRILSL
jgi:hypothetical protein